MAQTATPVTIGHVLQQRPPRLLAGLVEAAASVTALVAMGGLATTKLDTTVAFFGASPRVTSDDVAAYHRWLLVLAVAVVTSFVAALRRNSPRQRSLLWHAIVLVVGVVAALVFHVGLGSQAPTPVPAPDLSGRVCYSGGDSDECVGG